MRIKCNYMLIFSLPLLFLLPYNMEAGGTCPPLCQGQWSATIRAGGEPSLYACRPQTEFNNIADLFNAFIEAECREISEACDIFTDMEFFTESLIQKEHKKALNFSDQFHVPWTVGGEIACALTCSSELFLDFSYAQSNGKTDTYDLFFPFERVLEPGPGKPSQTLNVTEKYSDLESYGGYLGYRYYFPRCCSGATTFFVGPKVGARYWDSVSSRVKIEQEITFENGNENETFEEDFKRSFFSSCTVLSAGFQAGINYQICNGFSVVLTGEVVVNGSFIKYGKDAFASADFENIESDLDADEVEIEFQSIQMKTVIPVRRVGMVVDFPITLGIKKTF